MRALVRPRSTSLAASLPDRASSNAEVGQQGLLLDGRRKSMQPMAERLGIDHQ